MRKITTAFWASLLAVRLTKRGMEEVEGGSSRESPAGVQ
jgi:hypothetical protein